MTDGSVQYIMGGELIWRGTVEVAGQCKAIELNLADFLRLDEFRDKAAIEEITSAMMQALASQPSRVATEPPRSNDVVRIKGS